MFSYTIQSVVRNVKGYASVNTITTVLYTIRLHSSVIQV